MSGGIETGGGSLPEVRMPTHDGAVAASGQSPGEGEPLPESELVDAVEYTTTMQHILEPETQLSNRATTPPAAGSVPVDFMPVDVFRCSATMETIEDLDCLWAAVTQGHLPGNIDALLEVLAQPSDGPGPNQAARPTRNWSRTFGCRM